MDSSSESSNSMGGAIGFVFRFAGGPVKDGDDAGRCGRGSGGSVLGAGRMNGCSGGGVLMPKARSRMPMTDDVTSVAEVTLV